MVGALELCPITPEIAETYSRICRELRDKGQLIGGSDLRIAAVAMEQNLPLVTRNLGHFSRVEGLTLRSY
jgi:predicted nucleic acid-binding protein